jgi:hypothetical protein
VTDLTVYPSTIYMMDEMMANGFVSPLDEPLTEKAAQSMKIVTQEQHANSKWRCNIGR